MQKFSKAFGRRKSTNNALDDVQATTPTGESSFKVFERHDHNRDRSFDGGVKLAKNGRPNTSPLHNEDNMFEDLKGSRGSGASNTNTASTTDNSSRFSAASTTPSSTENNQHDLRSPHDRPFSDIPIPPVPKTASGFSLKAAGRTFSFGRSKGTTPPPTRVLEEFSSPAHTPPAPEGSMNRPRAVTSSSYASTATPPKLEERDLGLSLGGDFSDMFSGFGKRQSKALDVGTQRAMSQSPDYLPSRPAVPSKTFINRPNQPSPLPLDRTTNIEASPYSWTSRDSSDRLMANSSPLHSTDQYQDSPPPVPRHDTVSKQQRPGANTENGLRRSSALAVRRQSTLELDDTVDEDARLLRESLTAARRLDGPQARDSWINTSSQVLANAQNSRSSLRGGSVESTPKARKPVPAANGEDNMFDSHIASSANLAQRYEQRPPSPLEVYTPKSKIMTPGQFERYKQENDRLKSLGLKADDDDDEEEADAYEDEEDEAEKNRQIAKQRRKQEAHMAVYRQQMMKVTGEPTPSLPVSRPGMTGSQSSPNILSIPTTTGTPDDEESDEEVPLAILAAHGFPNKNRAPGRLSSMGSNPNLRASSQLGAYPAPPGSVVNGDGASGRLPVFARNLPQDPYFGAGLVNGSNRESLAYGSGAASTIGATPRGMPHGGLVGVIATEERSRAMRRGSPNAAGEFGGPPPANGFNGMGMPQNLQVPPAMRGMPPMGSMSPGDEAQLQMAQQMQQFMQMQMQFMQLMATSGGSQAGQPDHQRSSTMTNLAPPGVGMGIRPISSHGHQRAMTSLDPNAAPWMQQSGRQSLFAPSIHSPGNQYAPSIAPSERSNVGQPGRYRPVSSMPPPADKSRTNTMSGALEGWTENRKAPTIKAVKKSGNDDEEDDEQGWELMRKRRDKKRNKWRSKKDTSSVIGF